MDEIQLQSDVIKAARFLKSSAHWLLLQQTRQRFSSVSVTTFKRVSKRVRIAASALRFVIFVENLRESPRVVSLYFTCAARYVVRAHGPA